ncbi:MAG: DEAD/DEAH box helicase [Erysipelothrix sp.]|nr:DEAD/DEAH box helicase [Erysipelothrix sp.]
MNFNELNIIKPINKALLDIDYVSATPIQEKAIPHVLAGSDLLATAATGTGKTASFALPMLQKLFETNVSHPKARGLVIAPTRELAQQIVDSYKSYSKYLSLKVGVIFGGVSQRRQEAMLKRGVDIIVATPGRLIDLMDQKIVDLSQIEMFVLDEADRLLDMGFVNDINKIADSISANAQTLLFSATMPKEVVKISQKLLKDPVSIATEVVSSPAKTVSQKVYFVDPDNKRKLLVDLLQKEFNDSVLVFVRTKSNADRLTKYLEQAGITARSIHGDKSQNQRMRALDGFKNYKFQVLVATDVAARGIDIDKLGCVVNFNIPDEAEAYVHRIGRTGRAGEDGTSVSFCDHGEKGLLKDIQNLIQMDIPVEHDHAYPLEDYTVQPPNQKRRNGGGRGRRGNSKRGPRRGDGQNRRQGTKEGSKPKAQGKPSNQAQSQAKTGGQAKAHGKAAAGERSQNKPVNRSKKNGQGRSFSKSSNASKGQGRSRSQNKGRSQAGRSRNTSK